MKVWVFVSPCHSSNCYLRTCVRVLHEGKSNSLQGAVCVRGADSYNEQKQTNLSLEVRLRLLVTGFLLDVAVKYA